MSTKCKKLIFVAVSIATVALLILLGLLTSNLLNDERGLDELRKSVVMVTVGDKHASGVIVDITDDEVVIATCAHLIADGGYEELTKCIVTYVTNDVGFADVCHMSDEHDLCLLSLPKDFNNPKILKSICCAKVEAKAYEDLKEDDVVTLIGSAVNVSANITNATVAAKDFYVTDFNDRMLYLYADAMPGMSGGAVFDEKGCLLGIIAGGADTSEIVCVPVAGIIDAMGKREK